MIRNKIVLGLLLVDFVALNLYAVYSEGFSGLIAFFATSSPWAWVLTADLCIALFLIISFMFIDAKKRGENAPLGYTIATMMSGSIAPLIYLLRRPAKA